MPPDDSEEVPELITSREDFDAIMNEFLDNYEILGGKLRHVLPGETGADKLDAIRKGLGAATLRDQDGDSEEDDIMMPLDIDERKDRWDCETILSMLDSEVVCFFDVHVLRSDVQQPRKPSTTDPSSPRQTCAENSTRPKDWFTCH